MRTSITSLYILILSSFILLPTYSWAEDEAPAPTAIYYQLPEAITINFLNQSKQKVRYLQIKVALMSRDQTIIDSATLNLPMLQDALRTLFSEQTMASVNSVEGRQALQATSLDTIKAILKEETGKNNLDGLYFTSFILQ